RLAGLVLGLVFVSLVASGAHSQDRGFLAVKRADSTEAKTLYDSSFALVIGIDAYQDRDWPSLSNAVSDAKAVAEALKTHGFDVTLATNLQSDDLKQTLEAFIYEKGRHKGARLFIWFAGHGHTIDGEGYLVPADAPSPSTEAWRFRRKSLSLRRFGEFMREARAKHVLTIFDSCFSGTVFTAARSRTPPAITQATTRPVRQFVSSGEAQQAVSDDGTFRKLFLDALSGTDARADANRDGYMTGSELGLYLQQEVTNLTERVQTPRYGKLRARGLNLGDFVFRVGKPAEDDTTDDLVTGSIGTGESLELAFWNSIKDSKNPADFEDYVRRFPGGVFAPLAKRRIAPLKKLKEKKVAVGTLPKTRLTDRRKPGESFRDCDACPEMVVVAAGSFMMGSPKNEAGRDKHEGPQRQVKIGRAFAVAKFEVTFDEWEACALEGGCPKRRVKDAGWGRGRRPVIYLSWEDAKSYVDWLQHKTGKKYRLLSEAEWEFAARGGTTTPYSTGDRLSTDQANFDNSNNLVGGRSGLYRGRTVEVGTFSANPFGLHEMHGNVLEWVEDCWNRNHTGAPGDGSARGGNCERRVLRGGSWYHEPGFSRSAARISFPKQSRLNIAGLRVARTLA
ncbi:MAG: SUMF1/EgtB/PvdO family nonheme iron enzyme, partial [Hyphomicrobiaceae bacterium]